MQDSEVYDMLDERIGMEDPRRETIADIAEILSKIEIPYWSSKKIHTNFEEVYGDLKHHHQQQIKQLRQDLQSLYLDEEQERQRKKSGFKKVLGGKDAVVERFSDQILRRHLADHFEGRRSAIHQGVINKLGSVQDDLSDPSFNTKSAHVAINDNDKQRLDGEFVDFVHTLSIRGWVEDDLRTQIQSARNEGQDVHSFIDELNDESELNFEYQVFLPFLTPEDSYKSADGRFRVFKAGQLRFEDLRHSDKVTFNQANIRQANKTHEALKQDSSVRFSVEAFGKSEAKKKAENKLSEFLDAATTIHQIAYLEDPQFFQSFKYLEWRSDRATYPFIQWSREPRIPASLNVEQFELIEDLFRTIETDSPIARRLGQAVHFFRKGNISHRTIDTVVNYLACLETLTSSEVSHRSEITDNALQFARVHATAKEKFSDIIDTVYNARNAALHSGHLKQVNDVELKRIKALLSNAIWEIQGAIESNRVSTFMEFKEYITVDIQGQFRYVCYKITKNGLNFNIPYNFTGVASDQTGNAKFNIGGNLEFKEEGEFVVIYCTISTIDEVYDSISSNQNLNLSLDLQTGDAVELGTTRAIYLMDESSVELEFRDFTVK